MKCSEVMKRHVLTVHSTLSVNQAARQMKTEQIGFFPVCDDKGRPLGVLTDRDIVLRASAKSLDGDTVPVEQIMTPDPVFCSPEDDLEHAEQLILKHHTRRILILDRDRLVGLITLADIAQHQSPLKAARWMRELSAYRYRVER